MRPSSSADGSDVHECFDCGHRYENPGTGVCGECGGELSNLGVPRDV